ncbi:MULTISPECIES: hypothetical protein [Pseudomonas]|uniref:DUF4148 domain-containing protein n=1 Tax=Pseudomonas peradeniyensis TaxID=2745488 RepID=A0ABT2V9X7_9PSED|nr:MULTISPECIES: hypothetical protein [Pseudomonas]MCU7238197.1 hypothetical protein [Pseudomonas peradeniyensis]MCU7280437.1 hypothetical protein [Pseudomonas peradeniyensis]QZA56701.1 hypothetical protein K2O50_11890 [Pseudomonas sp. 2hn]
MKKVVLAAFFATAGLIQTAHGNELASAVVAKAQSPFSRDDAAEQRLQLAAAYLGDTGYGACPKGTARAPAGNCQPPFDFD